MSQGTPNVTSQQFDELFRALSNWGRWGQEDQRGALNHLTPERLIAAAGLVRDGVTVTLSLPLNTQAAMHNPKPADHYMTEISPPDAAPQSVHFLKDYVGADYHNDGHSHIDALCHVAYEGLTYNGRSAGAVTDDGAEDNTIEVLASGLIGRGVLLDIPRLHGLPWLEPGEHVLKEDLEAAERAQRVTVSPGDILLVRTGHARRLAEHSRSTSWPWQRWESTYLTTSSSRICAPPARRQHGGSSCSLLHRCGSKVAPAPRSTRRRSSDPRIVTSALAGVLLMG